MVEAESVQVFQILNFIQIKTQFKINTKKENQREGDSIGHVVFLRFRQLRHEISNKILWYLF